MIKYKSRVQLLLFKSLIFFWFSVPGHMILLTKSVQCKIVTLKNMYLKVFYYEISWNLFKIWDECVTGTISQMMKWFNAHVFVGRETKMLARCEAECGRLSRVTIRHFRPVTTRTTFPTTALQNILWDYWNVNQYSTQQSVRLY